MIKKWLSGFILVCIISGGSAFAAGTQKIQAKTPPKRIYPPVFLLDNFEDGRLDYKPKWWVFGDINAEVAQNLAFDFEGVGKKALHITGKSKEWYIGGLGAYFGVDTRKYNAIKMLVYGKGKNSGLIRIELYDDDNNNWEVERNPYTPYLPVEDDVFVHELEVHWTGWKVVIIPFTHFAESNPGVGDDTFNPYQIAGSGGLLQMQLIGLSNEKKGKLDVKIDSIKMYTELVIK